MRSSSTMSYSGNSDSSTSFLSTQIRRPTALIRRKTEPSVQVSAFSVAALTRWWPLRTLYEAEEEDRDGGGEDLGREKAPEEGVEQSDGALDGQAGEVSIHEFCTSEGCEVGIKPVRHATLVPARARETAAKQIQELRRQ